MEKWNGPCIIHVDLDAFFASVEQLDHPEYKGRPVIVGGHYQDKRGVVSTASYEARKYGVQSAMPLFQAHKLCPSGIFLRGRYERYIEKSKEVMSILYDFSPDVEQVSIDEAFIDITGTQLLFGNPETTAFQIKKTIKEKTQLTVSIGLASNWYIAKIASDLKKPDGFCKVLPETNESFMLSLPLNKLWGCGKKTQIKLIKSGLNTIAKIKDRSLPLLMSLFGNAGGTFLYNAVRGKTEKRSTPKSHSISTERTFEYDISDKYIIETVILELCHIVMFRLLNEDMTVHTICLKIRYDDFTTKNIQETFNTSVTSVDDLFTKACSLFEKRYKPDTGIRLIGLGIQNPVSRIETQNELFDFGESKKQKLEKAILSLKKKHPDIKIKKARLFGDNPLKTIILFLSILVVLSFHSTVTAEDNTVTSESAGAITFDSEDL